MQDTNYTQLKSFLEEAYHRHNQYQFIENDPIQIPHSYSQLQDIEITAFWTSMLAWGQRKTIINKSKELFQLMDNAPHDFMLNHKESDLKAFEKFKHRTFQPIDCLYFIEFFSDFYKKNKSLEFAFLKHQQEGDETIENMLIGFHNDFFALPFAPQRTRKHVASPIKKSTCKKLCMFFRWMVRQDNQGVDFGLWKNISPSQLLIPLDVHVRRVATKLNLLQRPQNDFKAVIELTQELYQFDSKDPVKYDFALFGLGLEDFA